MRRGDVYRVRLARARGHEQHAARYAVVVQADSMLGLSTVIVAPTSRGAAESSFRPRIEIDDETTLVLVEQLRAVDVERLGPRAGHLTASEQRDVDDALELVLGLG